MSELPPTDLASWGQGGTTGGPHASFSKRYQGPLQALARRRFPWIDAATAEDLAQGYCVRELERDLSGRPPVFEAFDPARGSRFRSFLRTCFLRYCRDELAKLGARGGLDLPVEPPDDGEDLLRALIARDLLETLWTRFLEALPPDARRYVGAKLPADGSGPRSDRQLAQELGVSRDTVAAWRRAAVAVLARLVRELVEDELDHPTDASAVEAIVLQVVEAVFA